MKIVKYVATVEDSDADRAFDAVRDAVKGLGLGGELSLSTQASAVVESSGNPDRVEITCEKP